MSTQQNIKINNVRSIDLRLYNDEYYDFMLYKGEAYGKDIYSDDVIADFSCPFEMEGNVLYSKKVWDGAKNDGALLEDIGFTGPDNGFIAFRKDRISNQDFLDILTGSTYNINSGDTRLFLTPVTGNTLDFDYPMSIEGNEDDCYISFKGGFYQGFYKLHNFDYQVLPNGPDSEWDLYFKIRPRTDYEISDRTINHLHPENNGIFFYIGTRAENKFWSLYKTDEKITEPLKRIPDERNYTNAGICGEESDADFNDNEVINQDYLKNRGAKRNSDVSYEYVRSIDENSYFNDDYLTITDFYQYKYKEDSNCCVNSNCNKKEPVEPQINCDEYFSDDYFNDECSSSVTTPYDIEYFGEDIEINGMELKDSLGHEIFKKGYFEIESDNKFLMFDRTKNGVTTQNWEEGTTVLLTGRTDWDNINYFPIMDRTKSGYTVDNIYKYQEENSIPYNIYKDIKNNTFGLRITENGAIGYRSGILDCES